jgi:hypothetical protein
MNPEMEKLLQLFDEAQQSRQAERLFEDQFDELCSQYSGISRDKLRQVVRTAYLRWLKANRKPPTIPPSA